MHCNNRLEVDDGRELENYLTKLVDPRTGQVEADETVFERIIE